MAIIPWSGFDDLLSESFPVMDVHETDDSIIAEVRIEGMDQNDIDISISAGFLKVAGGSSEKKEEKNKTTPKKEMRKGSFERVIKLPLNVNEDKVDAVIDGKLIRITVPKSEKGVSVEKKITIKEAPLKGGVKKTDKIKNK